jgi:plasmid stabilization system protein ParE
VAAVVWTDPARRDLLQVQQWIARDSRQYAATTIRRIRSSTALLAAFPESCRFVPEYADDSWREIIVGSYRVLYRYIRPTDTVVVTVIHARRQLPPSAQ